MSFFQTSREVTLRGSTLFARCLNNKGEYVWNSTDLNNILGNQNGGFDWYSQGFYASARNVSLNGPYLQARLLTERAGGSVDATVDLNQMIANVNGKLVFRDRIISTLSDAPPPAPSVPESSTGPATLEEKKRRALALLEQEGLVGFSGL